MSSNIKFRLEFDAMSEIQRRCWIHQANERSLENLELADFYKVKFKHNPTISALDIDHQDEFLLCGATNGEVRLFRADSKKHARKKAKSSVKFDDNQMISDIQWCGTDNRLFLMSCGLKKLVLCDTTVMKQLIHTDFEPPPHFPIQFHWNELHTTAPMIAVADKYECARIIDIRIGLKFHQLTTHGTGSPVTSVRWFPSNRQLLFTGDTNGSVAIFDVRTPKKALLQKTLHRSSPILAIRTTSDGLHLITKTQNCLKIHQSHNFQNVAKIQVEQKFEEKLRRPQCLDINDEIAQNIHIACPINDSVTLIQIPRTLDSQLQKYQLKGAEASTMCVKFRKQKAELLSGGRFSNIFTWSSEPKRYFQTNLQVDNWSDSDDN